MSKANISARAKQDGFVAFVVCILIAAVLTLISLSFATIISRAQRQALDNQLAAQAAYAAESGINYALNAPVGDTGGSCHNPADPDDLNVEPGDNTFKYICLIVDDSPGNVVFDSVGQTTPTVFYIDEPLNNLGRLRFSWQNSGSSAGAARPYTEYSSAPRPRLLPAACWDTNNCTNGGSASVGVLEVTVYPLGSGANVIGDASADAKTFYLYPTTNNVNPPDSTIAWSNANDGGIVYGKCVPGNTPYFCNRTVITSIPASPAGFIVKLRAIYNNLTVQINGENSGGVAVDLIGAQKLIDVTGRANDVLKRVRVRVPLSGGYDFPSFALETGENICKRLSVFSGGGSSDADCE